MFFQSILNFDYLICTSNKEGSNFKFVMCRFCFLGNMQKDCDLDQHIDSYERRGGSHTPHTTSLHNLENSVGRPSVIETSQPHIIECT